MDEQQAVIDRHWWSFASDVQGISIPQQFPFPFYYQPHALSQIAATQLQEYLRDRPDWAALHHAKVGKMFGVLVVRKPDGKLGFLAAFSGKVGDQATLPPFVPPFYDRLQPNDFFRIGEEELNGLNRQVEALQHNPTFQAAATQYEELQREAELEIEALRLINKREKEKRQAQRQLASDQPRSKPEQQALEQKLKEQSIHRHFLLKDLKRNWRVRLAKAHKEVQKWEEQLTQLKRKRQEKSASLQQQLFDRYQFLNALGELRKVTDIFAETVFRVPPAGAGDCAAPKLLQFAFQYQLKPIALAEFWWGPSPKSEVRKHLQFYPACRGKCEPILGHMLQGLEVEENPLLRNRVQVDQLQLVHEDEHLVIVNKPAGFLAVPGKSWTDSVYARMKQAYPNASGPLIVHRLDMSTSGLMLIAKTKAVHKELQHQFLKRTIKKRYVAVLEGELDQVEGTIDLPLRVDLEDRPRQLVCYAHGKAARTHFQRISLDGGRTRIHFFPITGRTHQLRVHSAHSLGLNHPIVGDDLYGTPADRLYLHAAELTFVHPVSGQKMTISCEPDF